MALNINWYFADKDGNIGYAFTGKYPRRSEKHDNRLPQSGAGHMEWNQSSRDKDEDGKYDQPATAIFRTFLPEMIKLTLADDLGDAFNFFAAAGYPTPKKHAGSGSNLQIGVKAIIESLYKPDRQKYDFFNGQKPETVVTNALSIALEMLEKEQGADMSKWRLPTPNRPFPPKNFLGIPQTSQDASLSIRIEQNRGTENDMIGRRWRHMNTGACIRHKQKFGNLGIG